MIPNNDINNAVERKLKEIIFKDLKNSRGGWDLPHTETVVFYIKEIIKHSPNLKLVPNVLVIAAYAHDWGYADYLGDNKTVNYDTIAQAKKNHMKAGAEKISKLLDGPEFNSLSEQDKRRIAHLVKIHDELDNIESIDERVLVEADTLGGLDINRAEPTFDKESNDKYMKEIKTLRKPLFVTDYGKNKLEELFKLRKEHYAKRTNLG